MYAHLNVPNTLQYAQRTHPPQHDTQYRTVRSATDGPSRASLERGLLDGPRLVGLGLLELGEPVRHLLPSFARDPCEGGRTLLVVVGVPEGQRGALGARTPRPADAMDVPELGIGIGIG